MNTGCISRIVHKVHLVHVSPRPSLAAHICPSPSLSSLWSLWSLIPDYRRPNELR